MAMLLFAVMAGVTGWGYVSVPTGFLPVEGGTYVNSPGTQLSDYRFDVGAKSTDVVGGFYQITSPPSTYEGNDGSFDSFSRLAGKARQRFEQLVAVRGPLAQQQEQDRLAEALHPGANAPVSGADHAPAARSAAAAGPHALPICKRHM